MPKTPPLIALRAVRAVCTLLALPLAAGAARADEGMWTFDRPPLETIRTQLGVSLSPAWLADLRAAAVNYGASASFVSANGLMLTNHHVALGCVQNLSSKGRDLAAEGYLARSPAQELRCPGEIARVLDSSEDVTERIQRETAAARDDADRTARRKAAIAAVEEGCKRSTGLKCEVVPLYSGAVFHLYRYQEWDDVRLVFAPEYQAAFFGGDPDNFVFPRFALDMALFRVYDKAGRPVRPASWLRLAKQPLAEGDPVFVAGHPGRTERLLTLAQLKSLRDVQLPMRLASARAQQALLQAYSKRSPEAARQALDRLFGTENWLKAMSGEYRALKTEEVMSRKAADEARFRTDHARLPASAGTVDPWAAIEAATRKRDARAAELWAVGYGYRTQFAMAGQLVEQAFERGRPPAERMGDYQDADLPRLERRLKANVPIHADLEVARLQGLIDEAERLLGAEHAYVRLLKGGDTSAAAAERLVRGSRLHEAAERSRLFDGGVAAIEASTDPLIRLAREVYPLRRALVRFEEDEVDTPIERAAEALGQARFALYGHAVPPDATGTLRLSFGRVAGYVSEGQTVPWKTTWGGWMARADSFDQRPPFNLSPRIAARRAAVDPRTPLNFVSTVDIIGGNSGSPVVNARGEWVGLIFDGNLEGLGGAYVYTDTAARALAVHADAILAALERVYGAPQLAAEMRRAR